VATLPYRGFAAITVKAEMKGEIMDDSETKLEDIRSGLQAIIESLTDYLIDDDFHPEVRSIFREIRNNLSDLTS
jgi:hypothetical protein